MAGPLDGIRVVEITAAQFGPQVGMFLGDWGADVIKIEAVGMPGSGPRRPIDTPPKAYFHAANRNKRAIALDLKSPEGVDICLQLLDKADVFVQNMRIGAMDRLGLGYEAVSRRNPRLIYASCSGFGPDGPYVHRRSLDGVAQAMSGLVASTGMEGQPVPAGATIIDISSSIYCASGILLALYARERDGKGQRVDASLLNSAIGLQAWESTVFLNMGLVAGASGPGHYMTNNFFGPVYGVYAARDGHFIITTVPEDRWRSLCFALGIEWVLEDPRFAKVPDRMRNNVAIREVLAEAVKARGRDEMLELLHGLDIACAPVLAPSETFEDPQVVHNNLVRTYPDPENGPDLRYIAPPFSLSRTPSEIRVRAPEYGEHTEAVLCELGFSNERIAQLRAARVIG